MAYRSPSSECEHPDTRPSKQRALETDLVRPIIIDNDNELENAGSMPPSVPLQIAPARAARSVEIFEALKRDIMLGELAAGEPLTELEIAARFQCSQGPVREALLQLQEEGLVLRQGHRGTRVSDCTADEAGEMFLLRQSLECRGIVRTLQQPSHSLLSDLKRLMTDMEAAARAGDEYRLAEVDRGFHRRLFRDARLPALEPILHRCLVHNHRFKISKGRKVRDLSETALRHASIIDAIERSDGTAATQVLAHHIATIVDPGPSVFSPDTRPQIED